jgi:hypothetical protein
LTLNFTKFCAFHLAEHHFDGVQVLRLAH